MRCENQTRAISVCGLAALAFLLFFARGASAQATHYLGSITALDGRQLTVKTDAGETHQVEVPPDAILKRIAPGEKDLTKAEPLDFSSLAVGDRVLVTLDPNSTGTPPHALRIIAIKASDVAQKQQTESAAWNEGVHGLVKSVDPATGTVMVTVRVGAANNEVAVHTTPATVLKRYAPGSVRFDQAQPGALAAIRAGDQIWARGTKNPDGSAIAADGVVSGSFRSIPGTVISADAASSTITVRDLATKKPVTVRMTSDAQLRRLDDKVAAFLAARLKGNAAAGGAPGANAGNGAPSTFGPSGNNGGGQRAWGQGHAGGGRMDLETILERAPAIQLGDLKKGDAVMIVATEDASGLSAVKLLAGVEPLLEAPEAQDLLSSWSLSNGESEAAQ
ncbi:MAG: hypothetical protein ACRD3S_07010 [Terracidiphilus sp.]